MAEKTARVSGVRKADLVPGWANRGSQEFSQGFDKKVSSNGRKHRDEGYYRDVPFVFDVNIFPLLNTSFRGFGRPGVRQPPAIKLTVRRARVGLKPGPQPVTMSFCTWVFQTWLR
jgi:hypothetical protein